MTPHAERDIVDGLDFIDWGVDAAATTKAARSATLDVDYDLLWALETSESALTRAVAATVAAGITIDVDLPDNRADVVVDYDYEYDLYVAMVQSTDNIHAVLFFDDEATRLREVVAFVSDGLRAGESVYLVLTPEIARSVRSALPPGLLTVAERTESLVIADANAAMNALVRDGVLDRAAFDAHMATTLHLFTEQRGAVRAYGEVVTLLWAAGNVIAALELERLWNELQNSLDFTVLCAYPRTLVAEGTESYDRVRECHSEVHVR